MVFYDFDDIRILLILVITIISFGWLSKLHDTRMKIWYFLLAMFLFIYSGIGGAIKQVNSSYSVYYCIYSLYLGGSLYFFSDKRKKKHKTDTESILIYYINRYGTKIIIFYLVLLLFDLVYPIFKLQLLFNPPTPSLEGLHYSTFIEGKHMDFISAVVYNLSNITLPFFYLALYKYRKNLIIVIVLLMIPVYIDLCSRGIVGRGQMLMPLMISFFSLYEVLPKNRRKLLIIFSLTLVPVLSYLLVQFSFMRIGGDFKVLSFGDCMQILFGQEIAYPLHFSSYIRKSGKLITDYILWIILLPLPGFLKFGYGDPQINLKFTELVTGMSPSDMGFSICLPGLVGESIFIFGDYLFPIHAIIMAYIISKLANYLKNYSAYRYLFFYVMLVFSYYINRGGTMSAYSFAFKQFIILILAIYFIKQKYHKTFRNNTVDMMN